MKNIVVFMQNRDFFGAQIVHIPLLIELKKLYPNSKLILFSPNKISSMLVDLNLIDEIKIEKSKFNTMLMYIRCKASLTVNLRKSSLFVNAMIACTNFREKIGFKNLISSLLFTKVELYDTQVYRAQNYLNLLGKRLELESIPKQKRILMIPGAGGDNKIWSINNYLALANILTTNYHYKVCFLLGKKESQFQDQIDKSFEIYYDKNIVDVQEIVQSSSIVIANDCGPSHFAQISDVKTIILFSNENGRVEGTLKEWFNSNNQKVFLIGDKYQSINSIKVDDVLKKVVEFL